MNRAIKFWNKKSITFDENIRQLESTYQEIMMHTSKHLKSTDTVLDIGCATGRTALDLSNKVKQITAIDISDKMIAIAKERNAIRKKKNIRFQRATVYDVQGHEEQFDLVLTFNMLHLLDDVSEAVDRIHDLLKPGGLLISSTPCKTEHISLNNLFLSTLGISGFVPHLKFSQPAELKDLVITAGFDIINVHSFKSSTPNYFMVAKKRK